MLFDPRSLVLEHHAGTQPAWTSHRQHRAAGCRPAHDFLTLPDASGIPAVGHLSFGDEVDLRDVALAQFTAGVLRASDVSKPTSAGDALAQALFAWLNARMPECHRLCFGFALIDMEAARTQVMQFDWESELEAPLYLAIELPQEHVYFIGEERANALRSVHPRLLFTAMSSIYAASARSLQLRTPDELLDLVARWHWEYDVTADDEAARQFMVEECGRDPKDVERYLPSVVRPGLAPDDVLPYFCQLHPESRKLRPLGNRALLELSRRQSGWIKELCLAVAELNRLVKRQKDRSALRGAQFGESIHSAAVIAYTDCGYVGEVLDDHYQCMYSGGESTEFQCFIPVATESISIRQQFDDLAGMLKIIAALDRVLTLISS